MKITRTTPISVTGCPKGVVKHKKKERRRGGKKRD